MPSIEELLEERHAKDVFITECKTGSSWSGCQRLDAWALRKTWSPWTTIGYEVKRSRSDFLRDDKWHNYLPLCHELYFVCPSGMIAPEELPLNVGLMWVAKTGTRLFTKRKAVRREPDADEMCQLMSYALMSRSRIVADMWAANRHEGSDDSLAYWRKWLATKKEKRRLGAEVGGQLAMMYAEMKCKLELAERTVDSYEAVRERLKELGLDPAQPVHLWSFNSEIDKLRGAVDHMVVARLRNGMQLVTSALDSLEGTANGADGL